jgi:hypothetical protein
MSQTKAETHNTSVNRLAWLVGGDILVLLIFVWVGRGSHSLPGGDIVAVLTTTAPFILSWFLVAPWFGLFRVEVIQSWRRLVPRLWLAWIVAGPLAALLRALFLGRPIPEGIIPIFVLVTTGVAGLMMLIWRLGYLWWSHRTLSQSG